MFNEYEIVIIVRADLDEAEVLATFAKVCQSVIERGGHVLDKEDWGKRKLAYLIQKQARGHYLMATVLSQPKELAELERRLGLEDRVIRFLISCIADAVDVEGRVAAAEERRKNEPDIRKRPIDDEPDEPEEEYDMGDVGVD